MIYTLNECIIGNMDVKQIRQVTGLTQKDFSSRYEIPMKTLQNWEAGKDSPSHRACPQYIEKLLEKAVRTDFPEKARLLDSNIDENHLKAIRQAKAKIRKSPLSDYVKDVYLYGSTAKGKARSNSDIDLLMILDENVKLKTRYNDWITYLKGNISSDDYNMPETDLHVAFGDSWKQSNDAYFSNVREEGFSIWN